MTLVWYPASGSTTTTVPGIVSDGSATVSVLLLADPEYKVDVRYPAPGSKTNIVPGTVPEGGRLLKVVLLAEPE